MSPTIRTLLASVLIASVAPLGAAILDLEQPACAKNNGNGNGGGNGNGNGGGHGNGNGGINGHGHGNSGTHGSHAKTADVDGDADEGEDDTADDGLSSSKLGKLNGVLNASPNAIAHASTNSPIGTARAFGEALAGFLGAAEEAPVEEGDEATAEEEGEEDAVTIDQLGAMMANMTNKPVTPDQVKAVAAKLGIESEEETADEGDEATGDETTGDETTGDETADEGEEAPTLDQATAEAIANKANEIHGFATDDDTTDDDTTDDDTADDDTGDDTGDETADNTDDTPEETLTN